VRGVFLALPFFARIIKVRITVSPDPIRTVRSFSPEQYSAVSRLRQRIH